MIRDAAGNLYGTTTSGGTGVCAGCGVVFKLDTTGTETALYSFTGADGLAGAFGSVSPLSFAHRSFCASAILRRTARLLFRRCGFVGSGVAAVSAGPPSSIWRSSAI
jgi:uncharacterized repeat protein (TIGR03803 family)